MKTYKITVNGQAYNVTVEETAGGVASAVPAAIAPAPAVVPAPAAAAPAPVSTPAPAATPAAPASAPKVASGGTRVESPLPGALLDYKVREGDRVKKGQVIVLIEAMKMENEIVSPCDGTVGTILIERGDSVNPGDLIMTIAE